eukprot:4998865-Amphidinium_carterae.2
METCDSWYYLGSLCACSFRMSSELESFAIGIVSQPWPIIVSKGADFDDSPDDFGELETMTCSASSRMENLRRDLVHLPRVVSNAQHGRFPTDRLMARSRGNDEKGTVMDCCTACFLATRKDVLAVCFGPFVRHARK